MFELVVMQGGVTTIVGALPEAEAISWLAIKGASHERHGFRVVHGIQEFTAEKTYPRGSKVRRLLIRRIMEVAHGTGTTSGHRALERTDD